MSMNLSRRDFAKTAGAAVLASPTAAISTSANSHESSRFPDGFLWGCATASYQIEGAVAEDGRKPSIWDTFSRLPGRVHNCDTGDVADDHYHRYKEDIQLLKALGVKAYRYSVAWPRVFPDGVGQPNPKGIDFYERVTDELLANGIQPFVTLYHWDLPQVMQDRFGGWESRDTSRAFADYAAFTARRLSDRVRRFFTFNEFLDFTDSGYGDGTKAPGLKLPAEGLNQVRHNAVLAHGLGVQAIRAAAKPGTQVGIAEDPVICVPVIETQPHIEAAKKAMRRLNAPFLTVVLEGAYLDSYLSAEGRNAPKYSAEDLKVISSPLDFVGVNVYTPTYIRADDSPAGFAEVPTPSSFPRMASAWHTIGPEIAYWAPRHLREIWNAKLVYITENGAASDDTVAPDGHIYDTDRVMYLRNHLIHMHRAISEGWPLSGYFLWSLMDNYEWADGYSKRFGIYYVDFATQKRIAKLSAAYYREVIARNAVL